MDVPVRSRVLYRRCLSYCIGYLLCRAICENVRVYRRQQADLLRATGGRNPGRSLEWLHLGVQVLDSVDDLFYDSANIFHRLMTEAANQISELPTSLDTSEAEADRPNPESRE